MSDLIRYKRGTAAKWANLNPILKSAEPGYETDTGRQKIGDGVTPWNDLDYVGDGSPTSGVTHQEFDDHINSDSPHPVYDDGPSFELLYENAKV